MEKIIKGLYLIVLFGSLLVYTILVVKDRPDSDELAIKVALNKANHEALPIKIGEIASLDSMVYKEKKNLAYVSPTNDLDLSHRYALMYQRYKDLLLFSTAGADSNNNFFRQLCERYPNKVESICYIIQSTDGSETPWEIPVQELINIEMTPSEMVVKCSKLQFDIDGWKYPITYDDIINGSITLLKTSIFVFMDEDIPMIDIYSEGNTVFWVFETKDSNKDFHEHGNMLSTSDAKIAMLRHIINVPNIKEYLKFFSSTRANLTTRYVNAELNDTVDITYHNEIIRNAIDSVI